MNPGYLFTWRNRFFQFFKDIFSSFHPFLCLIIKRGSDINTRFKQRQDYIVKKDTQIVVFQLRNKSKSKLLNYSYFTIFAPLITVGVTRHALSVPGSREQTLLTPYFLNRTSYYASNPDGGY